MTINLLNCRLKRPVGEPQVKLLQQETDAVRLCKPVVPLLKPRYTTSREVFGRKLVEAVVC